MKLSLVFELLMIFVLLAFAASKSIKHKNYKKGIQNKAESSEVDKIEDNSINKYCRCVDSYCNCCRDFALPLVNLNGPGCASLTYLSGDKMAVSLSFGKKVITNRTLSSRKPSPVCMPLPGGLSKFCGRVYNIARTGEDFRACLGLELQSKSVVEAAVRVSCFKFGAKGVTSEPADPLPLIPDEKGDKDDDDDDDDDYGLGGDDDDDEDDDADDDDDDDEESELEAVNDVGGSDYTGFSLLEEDLLGDLFGSSGGKKGNKNKNKNQNKNKKKQAPAPTTTTTKRPRRTRRPSSRRPNTRTTTLRPTRTTTVRVRPVNNQPTRRPSRRPTRPTKTPTTAQITEITPSSIITPASPSTTTTTTTTSTTTVATPIIALVTAKTQIENDQVNTANDNTFEPIIAIRPQSTTSKSVTNFEHTGLEMSLAHITGQLSSVPIIPLNDEPKDSGMATKPQEQVTYQKVEMITPKAPTTLPMETSSPDEAVNDDMIQIVQTLDSVEALPSKEEMAPEESRAYFYSHPVSAEVFKEAFSNNEEQRPKKRGTDDLGLPDLDVIGLTQMGETIGDELGIFGNKKRTIRNNEDKVKGDNDYSEYDDVIETMGDALLLARNSNPKKQNKKKRGRQNKMMRGDWALV